MGCGPQALGNHPPHTGAVEDLQHPFVRVLLYGGGGVLQPLQRVVIELPDCLEMVVELVRAARRTPADVLDHRVRKLRVHSTHTSSERGRAHYLPLDGSEEVSRSDVALD